MVTDANHLVYFVDTGQPVPAGTLPNGVNLLIDLYGGTTLGNMTLQQTTVITPGIPGGFGPRTFTSPNLLGGVDAFFQIQVRDSAYPTAAAAVTAGSQYFGFSQIFTMRPSSTIAFNSIVNPGGTSFSTWAAGGYPLGGGAFGAVPVGGPEPSSAALAGLGGAIMLFFRRRK